MPVTKLYVCDRCGKTQENDEKDMHYVGIQVTDIYPRYASSSAGINQKVWCRKCLVEVGIVSWTQPDATPPPTPPTLEDMIHEIVADAVANQE